MHLLHLHHAVIFNLLREKMGFGCTNIHSKSTILIWFILCTLILQQRHKLARQHFFFVNWQYPTLLNTMLRRVGRSCTSFTYYEYVHNICSNLPQPHEQVDVVTNGVFLWPMFQLNCLPILPLQDNAPRAVMAPSWCLTCAYWSQLGLMRMRMCSLITGLKKGPPGTGIGGTKWTLKIMLPGPATCLYRKLPKEHSKICCLTAGVTSMSLAIGQMLLRDCFLGVILWRQHVAFPSKIILKAYKFFINKIEKKF